MNRNIIGSQERMRVLSRDQIASLLQPLNYSTGDTREIMLYER